MEFWDVYDAAGRKTGRLVSNRRQLGAGAFQLAVEAWIVHADGRLLIQQRSLACKAYPGMWSITAGRVQAGEDSLTGCLREIREEIGLAVQAADLTWLRRIVRTDGSQFIWDVYCLRGQRFGLDELVLQEEEVAQVRWVSREVFVEMLEQGLIFSYPEIREILDQIFAG